MELRELDLNLLLVFQQLLQLRRVSSVAQALGRSQPAVSNALARLRGLLGDELFLRTSRGMEPTPYAVALAGPVAAALSTLHGALNQRASFDARTSTRNFKIAMTDIGEIYFLPLLIAEVGKRAPPVSITTCRPGALPLREAMETGEVDLAVGHLPELAAGFFQQRLFEQRYVVLMRCGHALDSGRISRAQFCAAEHVLVQSAGTGTGHVRVDELLARAGVQRKVRLAVPHFVALGHILQNSDLIATVTEKFAQRCAGPFELTHVKHPIKLPRITIKLLWHRKQHRDPGHQWLRGLMFEAFAEEGHSRR